MADLAMMTDYRVLCDVGIESMSCELPVFWTLPCYKYTLWYNRTECCCMKLSKFY